MQEPWQRHQNMTVQGTLPPMSREERMALQLKQVRVLALSLVPPM